MSARKMAVVTLNGQEVKVRKGETVLAVAERVGVVIPNLCHHQAVTGYGACRVCVVEVFWGQKSKLVTSCIYVPENGDVIETDNERVKRTRRTVLELLLARCPKVSVIRDMALEYGIKEPRFDSDNADERCILCGLCVRVCDEVIGQHAIAYARRGQERVIATPFRENAEACIGCGACVFICPTEALHYEDIDGERVMKELNTRMPLMECRACGKPFATEKQVAKAAESLKIPREMAETCPGCRGTHFRGAMEQALSHIRT